MPDDKYGPVPQNSLRGKSYHFLNLPVFPKNTQKKDLRIGIITQEIVGPAHGGVGTAYHAMAEALKRDGNSVTIFFVPPAPILPKDFEKWKISYRNQGIQLELFPFSENKKVFSLWANAKKSFLIMDWLKQFSAFDVFHFAIDHGLGYYTILCKHQGLAFQNTSIVLGAHSSTFWDAAYSYGDKTYYQDFLERNFLEKECVRLTDYLVSPSRYFLEFLQNDQRCSLPQKSYVQPNIMLSNLKPVPRQEQHLQRGATVKEFVFFGRLEKRKGLVLLCDALDHPTIRHRNDFSVSFMGHSTYIDGKTAFEYLCDRSKKWGFDWKIIPRKDRDEAIKYLQGPGRVALIPSLSETMSYTVLECLWAGIPFLASRAGGIPELISATDLERCTFEISPEVLAEKLSHALEQGVWSAQPSFDLAENEKQWVIWHQSIASPVHHNGRPLPSVEYTAMPKVSIFLSFDYTKLADVNQFCFQDFEQKYQNIEWIGIITGCHSLNEEPVISLFIDEFKKRGGTVFLQKNPDHGEGWNLASMHATGEYFLFLNQDAALDPEAIEKFVSVARKTGADILTTAHRSTPITAVDESDELIRISLGNCFSLGLLHNVFGEKGFFIKRAIWEKIDGFPKQNYGNDPFYDFFMHAILQGFQLETIPLPLIIEKKAEKSTINHQKFLYPHPFSNNLPIEFHDLLYFVQASRFFHDPAPDGTFTPGFVNRPQQFTDELWSSKPWKAYLPIANRIRRLLDLPMYRYPHVTTLTEALRAVDTIHKSLFWNLVNPIICIRRWFLSRKARR